MKHLRRVLAMGMATILGVVVYSLSWGQAIMPLSGTKGASSINDGVGQFNQRNFDSAASHFQKALKSNPRSAVAHYNLALVFNQMGKKQKAAHHFQKASNFGKTNSFIRNSHILKQHLQPTQKKR